LPKVQLQDQAWQDIDCILMPVIGILSILRTPNVVPIDPVMDSGLLSDDLFDQWMHTEKSIESWRIKFSLASSINSLDVTSELLEKRKSHLQRAEEYKTPSNAPGGGLYYNDQEILPMLKEFAYTKQI
jgi:hypothetical protein